MEDIYEDEWPAAEVTFGLTLPRSTGLGSAPDLRVVDSGVTLGVVFKVYVSC